MTSLKSMLVLTGAREMIHLEKNTSSVTDITICSVDAAGNDLTNEEIAEKILSGQKILVCIDNQYMHAEFRTHDGQYERIKFSRR